jgi:hypothetical protein
LKIYEPKPPGTLWATPGLLRHSFIFICTSLFDLSLPSDFMFFYLHSPSFYIILFYCILFYVTLSPISNSPFRPRFILPPYLCCFVFCFVLSCVYIYIYIYTYYIFFLHYLPLHDTLSCHVISNCCHFRTPVFIYLIGSLLTRILIKIHIQIADSFVLAAYSSNLKRKEIDFSETLLPTYHIIWVQTPKNIPTLFWLSEGTISPICWMYLG